MRDALIIGSGAGGSALALALAQAGLEVLVLEKGRRFDPSRDYDHDEVSVAFRSFFTPAVDRDPHVVVRPGSKPQRSAIGWTASCVGGGTEHMGAYLFRFHPDDFRLRTLFGERGGLADWPYDYAELEPYYARAEWEVGVSGVAGTNPFEGPRSRPFPLPPLLTHPLTARLDAAAHRLGLNPFPTPRAVNSAPYRGRPACRYCRFCAGFGCPTGARGSAAAALLPRAEATKRCRVRAETMVREITVGRDGRATGCIAVDRAGREHRLRARIVCLCASAIESARLLLLSRSRLFPAGLANGSGLVGRFLQLHSYSGARGTFPYDNPDIPEARDPHPFLERSLMDYYFLPPDAGDPPKGGLLRFGLPQLLPIITALSMAEENGRPIWGTELRRRIREPFVDYKTIGFEVFHDYLPGPGTFVELDPEVVDRWGLPVARVHLEPDPHHVRAGTWLVDKGSGLLREMGAERVQTIALGQPVPFLVHGTCRAGLDAASSVLDGTCRAHEVPNLYVVDGSFMPTSGGAPPTLTILANAFRTASRILEQARRGDL